MEVLMKEVCLLVCYEWVRQTNFVITYSLDNKPPQYNKGLLRLSIICKPLYCVYLMSSVFLVNGRCLSGTSKSVRCCTRPGMSDRGGSHDIPLCCH